MKEYDVIVIGSGAAMTIAANALQEGMTVALVEHGPMGGTCLNNGCIPTKVLMYPADVIRTLNEAPPIGVTGKVTKIDFSLIMKRTHEIVDDGRRGMEQGVEHTDEITWYRQTGEFIDDHKMKVGNEEITAPKIIIGAGSRPHVPPAEGLIETGFLNNISVLGLKRPPKSLVIIGGGYIACEFGHFFSAMGTKVTILGRNPRLLKEEEPEISEVVQRRFGRYVTIRTGHEVVKVEGKKGKKAVIAKDLDSGKLFKFKAEEILVAAGRVSNADLFKPERTGVEVDEHGWIKVDEYLETSKKGIWALGDALGKYMFRHTANDEAEVVWQNAFTDKKVKMDYHAVPHAVFGHPQVAGVGMTEAQVKAADIEYLVGNAGYLDVTKGYAMKEEDGLVKVIVDANSRKILGCHIVGPEAAEMVQQLVYMMNTDTQTYIPIARSQVIHPALSEVVVRAFANMMPPRD
jgi:dihydrolipoamide dehydrogenase